MNRTCDTSVTLFKASTVFWLSSFFKEYTKENKNHCFYSPVKCYAKLNALIGFPRDLNGAEKGSDLHPKICLEIYRFS